MNPETNSWAARRKATYLGSFVLILTAVSTLVFFKFWYKTPNCFDGLQNGDEGGIDCGGSCSLVCSSAALKPVSRSDPRLFQVSDNVYSVVAFVENHNIDSAVPHLPYRFQIYDDAGEMIYEREGVTALPKRETIAVFEGNIVLNGQNPKRVFFELEPNLVWRKDVAEKPEIVVANSPLLRAESSPRIEASVNNKSLEDLKNIELVAVVYDSKDNPIAASRTLVNVLKKGEKANVFFTWPRPFDLGEIQCEKPSEVVLAIDRSGSMQSLGQKPPEPLTSVKKAATAFTGLLRSNDSAGLVTFATDASLDSYLMNDFSALSFFIGGISIKQNGTQYTNIADAIAKSFEALSSNASSSPDAQKIIVILTDGVATRPITSGLKTEAEEVAYAESAALATANLAKQNGAIIYSIGLGKDIHVEFLKQIASSPERFLEAPATSTLESVYHNISTSICKELPSRIEIKYKILN